MRPLTIQVIVQSSSRCMAVAASTILEFINNSLHLQITPTPLQFIKYCYNLFCHLILKIILEVGVIMNNKKNNKNDKNDILNTFINL